MKKLKEAYVWVARDEKSPFTQSFMYSTKPKRMTHGGIIDAYCSKPKYHIGFVSIKLRKGQCKKFKLIEWSDI